MMSDTLSQSRNHLRKQLRQARKQLSYDEQQFAAQQIISPALELIEQYQAQHIAFYLPFDGEISPLALMKKAQQLGKQCYVPVLHPFSANQLLFLHYDENTLTRNRFGIAEPKLDVRNVLPFAQLEMIFVPLVGCDRNSNRLGMGGGFYDRTLPQIPKTISVGLAHSCQVVEQLPLASWDKPLDHLIISQ